MEDLRPERIRIRISKDTSRLLETFKLRLNPRDQREWLNKFIDNTLKNYLKNKQEVSNLVKIQKLISDIATKEDIINRLEQNLETEKKELFELYKEFKLVKAEIKRGKEN